jgi:hypothetical protein
MAMEDLSKSPGQPIRKSANTAAATIYWQKPPQAFCEAVFFDFLNLTLEILNKLLTILK